MCISKFHSGVKLIHKQLCISDHFRTTLQNWCPSFHKLNCDNLRDHKHWETDNLKYLLENIFFDSCISIASWTKECGIVYYLEYYSLYYQSWIWNLKCFRLSNSENWTWIWSWRVHSIVVASISVKCAKIPNFQVVIFALLLTHSPIGQLSAGAIALQT